MTETPEQFAEWDNAKPGDTLTLDGTWPCDAQSTTHLWCTRAQDHQGQHVATGGAVVIEVWPS